MPKNIDEIDFYGDAPNEAYNVMEGGAKLIKGVPGLTCEIGVRRGLGSVVIMKACQDNNDKRVHVGIDPWGHLPYNADGGRSNYTNKMKRETLRDLYAWCCITEQEFLMFIMKDTEFFERFAAGVPVHEWESSLVNEYAYVYIDGPHHTAAVTTEVEFFEPRSPVGAVWQFDNTNTYDHGPIHQWVLDRGFRSVTDKVGTGGPCCKQSYQRENL